MTKLSKFVTLAFYGCALAATVASMSQAQSQEFYPRDAGSWGGKVRSGPGTDYQHIDGLQEGAPVTLLENTHQMYGGYPWFRIRFKNGREGYKWGGILCSFDQPIPGIFQTCRIGSNNTDDRNENDTNDPNAGLPAHAGSWGGVVRSGPGMQYRKIGSLSQGEAVTILKRTGEWMNNYPWFRISYRGGSVGYKWGGILCSRGQTIQGLHRTCDASSGNNGNGNVKNVSRRVIKFARGKTSTTVRGGFGHGEREALSFEARRGQSVRLNLTSHNASFTLRAHSENGQPVSGVGDKQWSGRLPHSGRYEIVITSFRGGANYDLFLEIF